MLSSKEVGVLPILLLFFNRKGTLSYVIEHIRKYRPSRLYLAADGPRSSVQNETQLVGEIRQYVLDSIDWECEVKTLLRDENLGCKNAVHEAIQWFFSQERKGIVIEDDIVPSLSFFHFCEEALEFYKDDMQVSSIGGRNELGDFESHQSDIVFSSKFFCWGWASWADRVLGLDADVSSNQVIKKQVIESLNKTERYLVEGMYGLIESKQVNSWAYQYDINFRAKKQLQILPARNMIKNVGLATAGAHSSGRSDDFVERFDDFLPALSKEVKVSNNQSFIDAYLKKRYGNIIRLYVFSKIKYLKLIRQLLKRLR